MEIGSCLKHWTSQRIAHVFIRSSTVFSRINALGVEAENEPLSLSDFNEINFPTLLNTLTLSAENLIEIGFL